MIRLVDVYKAFGPKRVLEGFTLDVVEGETMVIIGYSGTGKLDSQHRNSSRSYVDYRSEQNKHVSVWVNEAGFHDGWRCKRKRHHV